jgi:hypothetical protein
LWQWRRGSKQRRESRYGGRFATLSAERKIAYEVNREKEAKRRKTLASRRTRHLIGGVE